MFISKSSWHWKVYAGWYARKNYDRKPQGDSVNLCPYMRVVLFWSWLRWLLIDTRIVSGLAWGTILGILPTYVVYKLGSVYGLDFLRGCYWSALILVAAVSLLLVWDNYMMTSVEPITPFFSLLRSVIVAAHKKICPLVKVRE